MLIASLSFFCLNVDKWSLICWNFTLARMSLGNPHSPRVSTARMFLQTHLLDYGPLSGLTTRSAPKD